MDQTDSTSPPGESELSLQRIVFRREIKFSKEIGHESLEDQTISGRSIS